MKITFVDSQYKHKNGINMMCACKQYTAVELKVFQKHSQLYCDCF